MLRSSTANSVLTFVGTHAANRANRVHSAVLPPSFLNKAVEEDSDIDVDNDNQGKGGGRHSDRKDGQQHIYESQ